MLDVSGGKTSADHKVTEKPTDKLFKVISHQKWHAWHALSLLCDLVIYPCDQVTHISEKSKYKRLSWAANQRRLYIA